MNGDREHADQIVALLGRIAAGIDGLHSAAKASPLLTQDQLAALLQVDRRTLRRLELSGDIPRAIKFGTAKRWRRSEIDKALAARRPA